MTGERGFFMAMLLCGNIESRGRGWFAGLGNCHLHLPGAAHYKLHLGNIGASCCDCAWTVSVPISMAVMLLARETWALLTGWPLDFILTVMVSVAGFVVGGGLGLTSKVTV